MRIAIALALMLSLTAVVNAGDPPQTSEAAEAGAIQPAIAADAKGKLYLAYVLGDPRQCWFKTSDDGKQWSEPEKVSVNAYSVAAGMTRGPRIALAKDDTVVITLCAKLTKQDEMHVYCYRKGTKDKAFAGARVASANAKDHEGMQDMAVDAQGDVHVTWLDSRDGGKGNQPWYARSSNGGKTFKGEVMAYKAPGGSICPCCAPSIAVSSDGKTVAIQFRNKLKPAAGSGADVHDMYTAVSTDGGKRFKETRLDDRERWRG